jgi:hypothetical protein
MVKSEESEVTTSKKTDPVGMAQDILSVAFPRMLMAGLRFLTIAALREVQPAEFVTVTKNVSASKWLTSCEVSPVDHNTVKGDCPPVMVMLIEPFGNPQ